MDSLIGLLKMLVKGALLFFGGLLVFGGGACALAGVANIGKGGAGMLSMIGISIVVGLVGWGMLQGAKGIKKDGEGIAKIGEPPSRTGKLVLILIVVWLVITILLSILQAVLR